MLIFYQDRSNRNPVKDFIESLAESANRKVVRAIFPLSEFGLGAHIKEAKKITGTKLWELRILGRDNIRIIYVGVINNNILLLHGFIKKTQKTSTRELTTALRRFDDWKTRNRALL